MPRRVIYSERAKSDLLNIERHIADAGSPDNAKAFVEAIVGKCDGMAVAAHQGSRRDDLLIGLRTTGFRRRVTIAFRVTEDAIQIVGVFYAGRSLEKTLKRAE